MKILLFGEYSGLHSNLKTGLELLGHQVTLVSFGDGFKKIQGDINIDIKSSNWWLKRFEKLIKLLLVLRKLKGFDIVQLIHPVPLFVDFSSVWYIKILKTLNGKVFLTSCGSDAVTMSNLIKYDYSPLQNQIKEGVLDELFLMVSYKKHKRTIRIATEFDGIISNMFSYHDAYKDLPNYKGFIPMASISKTSGSLTINRGYPIIKIFHGVTRSTFKGSKYIIEAMERIKRDYPESCEITIVEKVPYKEYVELFDDCHIFIDQACSYDYGMNALLGLVKGKVVLSGAEKETINTLSLQSCPIINIKPDVDEIYKTLKSLIHQQQDFFDRMAQKATQYIVSIHDAKVVAQKYIDTWERS